MWYFCPFAVSFYSGSMCGCPIFRNAYRIADYVAVGEARTEGYTLHSCVFEGDQRACVECTWVPSLRVPSRSWLNTFSYKFLLGARYMVEPLTAGIQGPLDFPKERAVLLLY